MKVTIDIPDELYRQVKAKSALEGRPVREVTEDLYRGFVGGPPAQAAEEEAPHGPGEEAAPEWFGALKRYARRVDRHDMEAIRESIARGISRNRRV